ncbi:MAG: hypothetical protein K2Y29_07795 [Beijerinckiaceae bacterium]|nr:hypothetical protein [Beijerinckiaceae bacterium]
MASVLSGEGLRFLYRSEEGVIDRKVWWLGATPLAALLFVMTAIWLALEPYARRGLDERAFLDTKTLLAYIYLMVFAFTVIFVAVCFVMLSMKRLRDRGRPTALAGALPLAALLAGAANWLEPQVDGRLVDALATLSWIALAAALAWTIIEMGVLKGRQAQV